MNPTIEKTSFGTLRDGTPVDLFTLRNSKGMEARITNYGGTVISLTAPDKKGKFADVVLGYDKLADYVKNSPYFGCLVGRYGNRIAKGRFTLNGVVYKLAKNNGQNSLHGGKKGFDKMVWAARPFKKKGEQALELTYVSKDGEEGFPGTLSVKAVYTLTEDNALRLDMTATTDKDTLCNLTHHSYFNLAGKGDILGHKVTLEADHITPVGADLIPTGELMPVAKTPFDFSKPMTIGSRINKENEQLKFGAGYDHNWVANKPKNKLGLIATVHEPKSGRFMEVLTTEPGVQLYTGNYLNETMVGKGGWVYQRRSGLALEPQHFPDSPNKPGFPSTVLKPGLKYKNTIIYRFSTK